MKIFRLFLYFFPLFILAVFLSPAVAQAQQQRQEIWTEETSSKLLAANQYAVEKFREEKKAKAVAKKWLEAWAVYGSFGYAYDDNVPLASDNKAFRPPDTDMKASRFHIGTGVAFTFYETAKRRAGVSYEFDQFLHTNGLNRFNFSNHEVSVYYQQAMTAWDRPSRLYLSYAFENGLLNRHTFSSSNMWYGSWSGEWAKNWVLTPYTRLGQINFRNKGFDRPISSRDGYYQQSGFLQTFFFNQRRSSISLGYEFDLQATEGSNFDMIGNGATAQLRTPLIEKLILEATFFFQAAYYPHFQVDPKRLDLRYLYEFRILRPIGNHWQISAFYSRTDVNNPHEGVLGQFSYERNIYGTELSFYYP